METVNRMMGSVLTTAEKNPSASQQIKLLLQRCMQSEGVQKSNVRACTSGYWKQNMYSHKRALPKQWNGTERKESESHCQSGRLQWAEIDLPALLACATLIRRRQQTSTVSLTKTWNKKRWPTARCLKTALTLGSNNFYTARPTRIMNYEQETKRKQNQAKNMASGRLFWAN